MRTVVLSADAAPPAAGIRRRLQSHVLLSSISDGSVDTSGVPTIASLSRPWTPGGHGALFRACACRWSRTVWTLTFSVRRVRPKIRPPSSSKETRAFLECRCRSLLRSGDLPPRATIGTRVPLHRCGPRSPLPPRGHLSAITSTSPAEWKTSDRSDRATVFVCPMRMGAGIKNKILQAWAMEKPVVATSTAIGGLRATPGENIVVATGAKAFAGAVVALLRNPSARQHLGKHGRDTILTFDPGEQQTRTLENVLGSA